MDTFTEFKNCLTGNKDWLSIVFDFIFGLATLFLAIISLRLTKRQNKISEELSALEKDRDQPRFRISFAPSTFKDEENTREDVLFVENVGGQTLEPFNVEPKVFVELKKYGNPQYKRILYAYVMDYLFYTYQETGDEGVGFRSRTHGLNGRLMEMSVKAAQDKINQLDGNIYHYLQRVLLLKISYTDIHKESHEIYYRYDYDYPRKKIVIDKSEYDRIVSEGNLVGHTFFLQDISYEKLKEEINKDI